MSVSKQRGKYSTRSRPRALDTEVVAQVLKLEAWAYLRGEAWKKQYRHTLIEEFRKSITSAKKHAVKALDLPMALKEQKYKNFCYAHADLTEAESHMDLMIQPEFNIMSEKEWCHAAELIDEIRVALHKLINSLG